MCFNAILSNHPTLLFPLSPKVYSLCLCLLCSLRSKSERERQLLYINACIWNLERWYGWSHLLFYTWQRVHVDPSLPLLLTWLFLFLTLLVICKCPAFPFRMEMHGQFSQFLILSTRTSSAFLWNKVLHMVCVQERIASDTCVYLTWISYQCFCKEAALILTPLGFLGACPVFSSLM